MAGRHRSDHVAAKIPDEPGPSAHSRHAGHALRGQSACPRPQYPTLRGNRTIKNEAKEKPRVGNIRFYPPATRRQANILHRTAKTCTSTPSANNFLPPRQLLTIAQSGFIDSHFLNLLFPASFTAAWRGFGTTDCHCYAAVHEQQRLRSPGHPRVPHDRRQLHVSKLATRSTSPHRTFNACPQRRPAIQSHGSCF